MRNILINAINARFGGGQTYLLNLLPALPEDGSLKVTLLVGPSFTLPADLPAVRLMRVAGWIENPLLRPLWERFVLPGLLKKGSFDLLFCPGGVVGTTPPPGCKLVTMFRNMLPFDLEQRRKYPLLSFQRLRNWLLARIMLRSMLRADLVIFISDYARRVIESAAAGRPLRGVTIPHGIAELFRRDPANPLVRPNWAPENYLLYVSSIYPYKAQREVVQAFAQLTRHPELNLLLVGPEEPFYAEQVRGEISRLNLNERVHIVGKVPYPQLPALYQSAVINIFASECENCPNILLEALASGRPVLCSNRQPMPEFAADAALYFDPANPTELADTLNRLLADAGEQQRLSGLAIEQASRYSWQATAAKTWQALANLRR